MNFYAISGLINAVTSLLLGGLVFRRNKRSKANITFSLFCLAIVVWSFAYLFWQISKDASSALFWSRALMFGAIWIPIFYFHFVVSFLKQKRPISLVAGYVLAIIFVLSDFTNYFVVGVSSKLNFPFWPEPGIFFTPFLLVFFGYSVYSIILLWRGTRTIRGNSRRQIWHILVGFVIGLLGGSTNYFLWYDIPVPPIGNVLVLAFVVSIAYAIIRYRLFDVKIIFRRSTIYLFIAGFAYAFFFFAIWITEGLFDNLYSRWAMVFGAFLAIIFAYVFLKVERVVRKLANRWFFGELYSRQHALRQFSEYMTTIVELGQLSRSLIKNLVRTMHIDDVALLLKRGNEFRMEQSQGFADIVVEDNALTGYLERHKKALVYEELAFMIRDTTSIKKRKELRDVRDDLKAIGAAVCLPLILKNRLRGLIILGNKISRDAYTKEDIDLLEIVAGQAALAIENARFYSNMEEQVRERTKEVRAANKRLSKLLKVKSEFLKIASHQLRTPVSIIRGMLSMVIEGSVKGEQKEEFIKDSWQTSNRMNSIITDLLDASEMEGKKLKLNLGPAFLSEIISDSVKMFKQRAEEKRIYIKWQKPAEEIPLLIDKERIRGAMDDLIDNAIKYTKQGEVEVSLQEGKKQAIIRIRDTGIGLKDQDKEKLFNEFVRSPEAIALEPNGSGLGLFIVKKIIEAHNGTIIADSPGPNKGTAFTITLPVKS